MSRNLRHVRLQHFSARTRFICLAIGCLLVAALTFAFNQRSQAATPANGTLTTANTASNPLTYTAGPFYVANPSGLAALQCGPAPTFPCDDYALDVNVPDGLLDTKQIKVAVQWPSATADFDVTAYLRNPDGTPGAQANSSGTSADPEVMILPAVPQKYLIRVVPFNPQGQSFTATITFEDKPRNLTQGTGTAPIYKNYAAPPLIGSSSGEPSIGIDWKTGKVMFKAGFNTLRVTFDDTQTPATATWENKTPPTSIQPAGLDPILFTDHNTGRTIVSELSGTTSLSSVSDDDGNTWIPEEGGPLTSGVDHQTVGGGPYAPPLTGTAAYPDATYYCSQDLVTAFCARSDDGGLTYGPTVPLYTNECGGIHGHVKVAPDGTVYVPNRQCGTNQGAAISEDNGLTWTVRKVVDSDPTTTAGDSVPGDWDPSVGIGAGGTVYFGYKNGDGRPHVAVSHDKGRTWANDQNVGLNLNLRDTAFPAVVAGDDDRAAFAFLGTDKVSGSQDAVWHLYVATTYDGGNSWLTTDATPYDPVQLGTICPLGISCSGGDRNLLDFIDANVDRFGRVLVAYADGCLNGCVDAPTSRASLATIARQQCGRRLFHQFDPTTDDCTGLQPTPTPTPTPYPVSCAGLNVVTDDTGDAINPGPGGNVQPGNMDTADIESISFSVDAAKTTLTTSMKLKNLSQVPPQGGTSVAYNVAWTGSDGKTYATQVQAPNANGTLAYIYGEYDPGANQLTTINFSTGTFNPGPDGTVTVDVPLSDIGNPTIPISDPNGTPAVSKTFGVVLIGEGPVLGGAVFFTTPADRAPNAGYGGSWAICQAGTPTPTPTPTQGGPLVLHLHGNPDDVNGSTPCTGTGPVDVTGCGGPYLKPNAPLFNGTAAHWDTANTALDGTAAHNIYDPNWTWNSGSTRLGGQMSIDWWASCGACGAGIGNANWTIRLWADGTKVFEQVVTATPSLPNVTQLLHADLFLPELTAQSNFILHIDPQFIDTQNNTHIYYDSQLACPGTTAAGPCDSRVTLPVLAPGQPAPTPTPTPTPTSTPNPALVPRYFNYTAPAGVAESAGEPSVGVNWKSERTFSNSGGAIPNGGTVNYFGGFLPYMLRITFDDSTSPAAVTWDQAPLTIANAPRLYGDPILFTDHQTGRTWVTQEIGLTPLGSTTEFTDDDGRSFKPSEGSGLPSGIDHPTVGGGPYHAPLPTGVNPVYPNAVYYCSQDLETATCSLSLDGGMTFGPGVPMYTIRDCGGIHGHVKVGPDGSAYVPNRSCNGEQGLAVSHDNGITWTVYRVTGSTPGDTDPSVGVANDGSTIFFGWEGADGHPRIAVSRDQGQTWSAPYDVGAQVGVQNSVFPAVVAGDGGTNARAAFAFYGSTTGGAYNNDSFTGIWYLYVASTFDGGQTWTTVNATPGDPVQRGRICTDGINCTGTSRNLLDFFDASVDKEGRVVVGYDDGCIGACVQSGPNTGTAKAVIARQSGGLRLFSAYDPPASSAPAAPGVSGTVNGTTASLSWSVPDNGGAGLTGYKVYRRDGVTVTPLATVTGTTFTDTAYNATTKSVYRVTAVNANGESAYKEFNPANTVAQSACVQPGLLVVSDVSNDGTDLDGNQNTPPDPRVNIKALYIAEPFLGAGQNKLVFTLKVGTSSTLTGAPPSSQWFIIWNRPVPDVNFDRWYVAMKTDATGTPSFEYGKFGVPTNTSTAQLPPPNSTSTNQPVTLGAADGGSYDPVTGTITITISTSKAENIGAGYTMRSVNARTFLARPDAGIRSQNIASDITGDGTYTLVGNSSCAVAALAPLRPPARPSGFELSLAYVPSMLRSLVLWQMPS